VVFCCLPAGAKATRDYLAAMQEWRNAVSEYSEANKDLQLLVSAAAPAAQE
jgi:hypothetical protein